VQGLTASNFQTDGTARSGVLADPFLESLDADYRFPIDEADQVIRPQAGLSCG
jgi:hypothetical protein